MPRPDRENGAIVAPSDDASTAQSDEQTEQPGTEVEQPDAESAEEALERFIGGPDQPVTLSAKISEDGPLVPDGLVWRIYDTKPSDDGQLNLVGKSENPTAVFKLAPGQYVVHVAYGYAQVSDTLTVEDHAQSKTLVLEAGGLRLNAEIEGDISIPPDQLKFTVYSSTEGSENDPLASNVKPNQLLQLNAGVYHVISYYGAVNAIVRADLRVDPGQLTDATLYHHASQVSFRLVSEEGGEAIADVEWRVVDQSNSQVLFSDVSAFPTTVLEEGDYTVIAKRGANTYNRDFSVGAGNPSEIEVLTSVY